MNETIVLDTPEQIGAWYVLSAISQLGLEIKTGMNFYGSRGSVLKGIQARGMTPVTGRATKRNKMLALAGMLHGAPDSPVINRGRAILAEACEQEGIEITVTVEVQ